MMEKEKNVKVPGNLTEESKFVKQRYGGLADLFKTTTKRRKKTKRLNF